MSGVGAALHTSRTSVTSRRARSLQQAAHDIRTPLATVVQAVDALLELSNDNGLRARRVFDVLRRNVLWMGEVLEASAAPVATRRQEFDLVALARETIRLIEPVLKSRGQSVAVESTVRAVYIRADYGTVMRALLNLLDNASKYGPRGDGLTVSIRRRKAGTVVAVADHGPGIPKGDRHAIFRAFYRISDARRSGQTGIGLGLASVREVAEAHGGNVGASCVEGTTRVWFCLADQSSTKRNDH